MEYYGLEQQSLDSYFQFREMTAPGTPQANELRLYAKDKSGVSNLYFKNDAGTEFDLGAGGIAIGDPVTSGTTGSVLFVKSGPVLGQDNADFFWDTSNKGLALGATALLGTERLHTVANANAITCVFDTYSGGATAVVSALVCRAARGTSGTPTALKTDDIIGNLAVRGYGSTGFGTGGRASIRFLAGEDWDDSKQGAYVAFTTTALTTTTGTTRVIIPPDGGIAIQDGITAPATLSGWAKIYVDTADGDLKVKFGDGTVKTIVTDT